MIDWKYFKNFDWLMLFIVLIVSIMGILLIYSACYRNSNAKLYLSQILWLGCGLILVFIIAAIDYHSLAFISLYFYLLTNLGLIYLLIFGRSIGGSKSWIKIAQFSLQPSEFAKIACILMLAYYFSELQEVSLNFRHLFVPSLIVGLPFILVLMQPDLGTALTFIPIFFGISFIAGVRWRTLLFLLIILLIIFSIGWFFFFKDYQRARLLSFFHPSENLQKDSYQSIQSKIAVGSGGLWGKGFLLGSQSHLRFVPAQHTDFIFSLLAEEFGLAGSVIFLILYLSILLRSLGIATQASDRLGIFLVSGVISLLFFHLVINIGMIIGLMPIAGIPLPLISYGGSSLISFLIGIALVINVRMRRFFA